MTKSSPTFKSQTFTGKIIRADNKNQLIYFYPAFFQRYLEIGCRPGDNVIITLTNKKPKRTAAQNNYYWLYLTLISLSSGHTLKELNAEMLHSWAKGKFLSKGIIEVFGDKVRKVKSTTNLTRPEFCEYIMRIEETTGIPAPTTEPFLKPLSPTDYQKLSAAQRAAYEQMKNKIFIK